jgi:hypothetical protein
MKPLFIIFLFLMLQATHTLFDFSDDTDISSWTVVNDGVMGGRSKGHFSLTEEGHGLFRGVVSLENNGGFSMVQHGFRSLDVSGYRSLMLVLKGDGKDYQVRVKTARNDYYSYTCPIKTSGEWQTIVIPFNKMMPQFRGRRLPDPPFPGKHLQEVAILIGNKKAEEFAIEISRISVSTALPEATD